MAASATALAGVAPQDARQNVSAAAQALTADVTRIVKIVSGLLV
jgi:hypothetical protein